MSPLSFYYFFSYWVFAWYLCYELEWTKYNPYLWLWFAFVSNLFFTFAMIYYRNDSIDIVMFLFINLLMKGLPIWLLWGSVIRKRDILFGLGLFAIYLAFIAWNHRLFQNNVFYLQIRAIQKNQPITPFVSFVKKWIEKNH